MRLSTPVKKMAGVSRGTMIRRNLRPAAGAVDAGGVDEVLRDPL